MAKKKANTTATFALFPNAKGDLYTESPKWRKAGGKFVLDTDLTQKELEYLYTKGNTKIVYKVED